MTTRWILGTTLAAAGLVLAACGGGDTASSASTAEPAASAATAAASSVAPTPQGSGAPNFDAFRGCMAERGIELPEMGQGTGGGVPGSGQGAGAGPGRGFAAPEGVDQAAFDAAMAECQGTMPQRGAGFGTGSTATAAYRACLNDNGVAVGDEPGDLQAVDRDDPAVQEAMAVCEPLLPKPSPSS